MIFDGFISIIQYIIRKHHEGIFFFRITYVVLLIYLLVPLNVLRYLRYIHYFM